MKNILFDIFILWCFLIAGALVMGRIDLESAIVTDKIVKASPKPITHYTIKQDSPGLPNGWERAPLPLTHPLEKKE